MNQLINQYLVYLRYKNPPRIKSIPISEYQEVKVKCFLIVGVLALICCYIIIKLHQWLKTVLK